MINDLKYFAACEYAKTDLLTYAKLCINDKDNLLDTWHAREIIKHLEWLASGKIKNLMVNLPPRHGKSILCSQIFPAWLASKERINIIITAYGDVLATKFTSHIRTLIQDKKDIFDNEIRKGFGEKNNFHLSNLSTVLGASIGGGIGGHGANFGIIDDYIKNSREARSQLLKDDQWEWYQSTFMARLEGVNVRQLVASTTWATDDLRGRILETQKGEWTVLNLPVLYKGKSLWPERRSTEEWLKWKSHIDPSIWASVYMQQPIDIIDGVFSDVKPIYDEKDNLDLIARIDPAFGGQDYNALVIAGKTKGKTEKLFDKFWPKVYIKYGTIWRGVVDDFFDTITETLQEYQVSTIYIESNQAQILLKKSLEMRGFRVIAKVTTKNKFFRITSYLRRFWSLLRFSSNITDKFMQQILQYHSEAKHDDAPDVLAAIVEDLIDHKEITTLEWS